MGLNELGLNEQQDEDLNVNLLLHVHFFYFEFILDISYFASIVR